MKEQPLSGHKHLRYKTANFKNDSVHKVQRRPKTRQQQQLPPAVPLSKLEVAELECLVDKCSEIYISYHVAPIFCEIVVSFLKVVFIRCAKLETGRSVNIGRTF